VTATAPPAETGTTCPRCGAYVAEQQDWCLRCGDAARTRLVPTPNWRLPLMLAGIVAALALLVIAISFVQLTRNDAPVTPTTTAPPAAAAPPPATTAPPTTAPPATTAPGATTTAPGATTTAPGATATTPGATATTPGATTTAPGATTTAPGTTTTAPGATTTTP
jgi:hypothetical protein